MGLAGYWRTPELLRSEEGRAAVGLPDDERFVGLLHLGEPRQEQPAARAPAGATRRLPRLMTAVEPMLSRAAALEAIAGERFEVVVIGGGITGAGVALDAASRGYSVALLERDDYAVGTSSRSSKMVHGGLRYLQNFDLGLVREALLERQLMVQLAPHLVYPTPFLVPTLGEDRRDRRLGIGLNMYDVMATTRVGRSRRELRALRKEEDEDFYWSPDRHRTITGEEVPSWSRRSARARPEVRLPLLRLPDRRRPARPHRARRGRALRRRVPERRRGHRGARARTAAPPASPSSRPTPASGSRSRADNVVNATGVWADRIRPEESSRRRTCRGSRPAAAPTSRSIAADLPIGQAACIVPAGEGRTIFALPWYGRTLVGTTDNDYEGDIAHLAAGRRRHRVPARRGQRLLRHSLGRGRPDRRLRRRAAADLDRRPAQVGRHLAQGRALRDLVGDADDHRRQADDLAADGEADRRPAGRARGPRGALPHRRDPARDGGRPRRPRSARRASATDSRRLRDQLALPLRPRRAQRARARRASDPSSRRRSSTAGPTCSPRSAIAARLEQARSVADVLLRRTRLGILAAPQLRDAEAVRAVAEALGDELGWDAAPGQAARPRPGSGRREPRGSIRPLA